jgi:tetratricopeptide (TPR) repeat protein
MTVGMPDSAVRCFNQACSLPAQGCLAIEPSSARSKNPTWFLGHCEENRTLTDTEYTRPGNPGPIGARAVRIGDRTLVAQPIRGPSIIGSRVIGSSEAPSGQAPKTLRAWGAPEQAHTEISLDLPDAPPANCSTPVPLQEESRRQVNLGDSANNGGDVQQAIDQYRAAISLYPCNGLAWAALGKVALSQYQFGLGVAALETATRLRPDHYGAFTNLGLAYEELGESQRAEQAFDRALDLQPGHPPALEGLRRVH